MAVVSDMRQRSLQQSIFFMQQEHASTLKGLHGEIEKLQKRCSDLTFQLAMETTSVSDDSDHQAQNKALTAQVGHLETQLQEQVDVNHRKDRRIATLEQKLAALDRKHADELRASQKRYRDLAHQTDRQAESIAHLTQQLHRRSKLVLERRAGEAGGAGLLPQPPPAAGHRTHSRGLHSVRNRPPSSRRLSSEPARTDADVTDIPDPSPFLKQSPRSAEAVRRAAQPPLPPIAHAVTLTPGAVTLTAGACDPPVDTWPLTSEVPVLAVTAQRQSQARDPQLSEVSDAEG